MVLITYFVDERKRQKLLKYVENEDIEIKIIYLNLYIARMLDVVY